MKKPVRRSMKVCVCCGYKHSGGAKISALQCTRFTTKRCKYCGTCDDCCPKKGRH